MALDKQTLENKLKEDFENIDLNNGKVTDQVAKIIADAIDDYIKQAIVDLETGEIS